MQLSPLIRIRWFLFLTGLFRVPLTLPLGKFLLPFLAFEKGNDIWHDASRDSLNLVLGNVGVVDYLFSSTQIGTSI